MLKKMGFWSVLAMVIGSQIGSGVFMLPANLAPFGVYSIAGCMISGIGAIILALVFANLCSNFPKTGGPHVYIEQVFGKQAAFFVGWTYWVISWTSTTAVVITAVGCLSPLLGKQDPIVYLWLELGLLLSVVWINLLGVSAAGKVEAVFTVLKFIPLLVVPMGAIWFFDSANFYMSEAVSGQKVSVSLAQASLIALWGFIGLESATTPAGSVNNPERTIPKAIVIGTAVVAIVYMFNSLAIIGLIHGAELQNSSAPYVDAAQQVFGGHWHVLIAIAASIVCVGTLNAWTMTSGQISLGLAEDKMLPHFFSKRNSRGAPYISIMISCLGMVPLLVLTVDEGIAGQVATVIDFTVTSFLCIYLLCGIANLVISMRGNKKWGNIVLSIMAIIFCGWVICDTSLSTMVISSLFTLSGVPLYLFWYKRSI